MMNDNLIDQGEEKMMDETEEMFYILYIINFSLFKTYMLGKTK